MAAWMVFRFWGDGATRLAVNLIELIGPALGGAVVLVRAFRPSGRLPHPRLRAAAVLLACGSLSFALGQAVWTWYEEVLRREAPFPSAADILFLLEYPFFLAGVLLLPARRLSPLVRSRVVLDGLMAMAALFGLSWHFLMGPILLDGSATPLAKALGLTYPLGDLVLLFSLLSIRRQASDPRVWLPAGAVAAGFLGFVVADTAFSYLAAQEAYHTGTPTDLGWLLGCLLICLGAVLWLEHPLASAVEEPDDAMPVVFSFVPYLLVLAVGAVVWREHQSGGTSPAVAAGTARILGGLVLLVLLRQVFAILETRRILAEVRRLNGELSSQIVLAEQQAERLELQKRELTEANARLEGLATTDGMTGLPNYRAFQDRLREEAARARRSGAALGVLLLDVDHFKHFNDSFGHPAGDAVLRAMADVLRECVRLSDFPARYGGEEFAVILPGAEPEETAGVAERIRKAVMEAQVPHGPVTVSIGASNLAFGFGAPEELIKSADAALYLAKRTGRNRVVSAGAAHGSSAPRGSAALEDAEGAPGLLLRTLVERAEAGLGEMEGLLQDASGRLLSGMLVVMEVREGALPGHCQRLIQLSLAIADELMRGGDMLLTPGDYREVVYGALLHDVGLLEVPPAVLRKKTDRDAYEEGLLRRHTEYGPALIEHIPLFTAAAPVIRHHHERWDGQGYPDGLAGADILLAARIFAAADAVEAALAARWAEGGEPDLAQVRAEIGARAGAELDPQVAAALLRLPDAVLNPTGSRAAPRELPSLEALDLSLAGLH